MNAPYRKRSGVLVNVIVTGLLVTFSVLGASQTSAQVDPITGGVTVGAVFAGLNQSIQNLTDGAAHLLEQGDAIAARQQTLMAEMLRSTCNQLQKAVADDVNLTFDRLDISTQGAIRGLAQAIDDAKRVHYAQDIQNTIRQATTNLNQILDRIPTIAKRPVVLGMTADDLLSPDAQSSKIIVLGYHLFDPGTDVRPEIMVEGTAIPRDRVTGVYDELTIALPRELEERLRGLQDPCKTPQSLKVEITCPYTEPGTVLLAVPWSYQRKASFSQFLTPIGGEYQVTISADFEGVFQETTQTFPFTVSSNSMGPVRDGNTYHLNTEYNCPEGAFNINCAMHPHFTNPDGFGENHVVVGLKASGSGWVKAQHTSFPHHYPGRTWGNFTLDGSYQLKSKTVTPVSNKELVSLAIFKEKYSLPMPSAFGKVQAIRVSLKRLGCNEQLDYASQSIPQDFANNLPISSQKGRFIATLSKDLIQVEIGD